MKRRMPLATRILWGLVIGVVAALATLGIGQLYPPFLEFMQDVSGAIFDPFGQVFLRLLFFVVIPLVFSSLASGVTQLGRLDRLGPLAGRTFVLFVANMLIGVAIGLVMMNVLQPGHHMGSDATTQLMSEYGSRTQQTLAAEAAQPAMSLSVLVDMFMPRNLLGAVAGPSRGALGEVLPLILFAILVGAAATGLAEDRRASLQRGLDIVTEVMTRIVDFALKLAPFAVPAMIYSVIVKVGVNVLLSLSVFVAGCVVALALHLFGTMSVWIRLIGKRSPGQFFRHIRPVLVTGVLDQFQQCHAADFAGGGQRNLEAAQQHRQFRAVARCDHEHERHGVVRRLRGAVHRTDLRHRTVAGATSDPDAARGA
jgi:DAACS family dicarboxylate/amino acid:cation (Na+ or H+) symporter